MTARLDPALSAQVTARRPLLYTSGPSAPDDRPAHVRSASGIVAHGASLFIVQDDASFVARVDRTSGTVDALLLPFAPGGARQFDDRRGNKAQKLDLEACILCSVDREPCLVAFGSGSTPERERAVVVPVAGARPPRVVHLPRLYAAFRDTPGFCGSELNVEGAVVLEDVLRFFQRGNGAPTATTSAVDATADVSREAVVSEIQGALSPALRLENVRAYELGSVHGVRLTFTDATSDAAGRVLYLAAAESSPDAVRDGPVVGAAVGVIDRDGARYAELTDTSGRAVVDKVEGIALDPDDPARAYVVTDADDPDLPSELCVVELRGYG